MSTKKISVPIKDVTREDVDSDEELYFAWYCQELIEHDILLAAEVNKQSLVLSQPVDHTYILHGKKKSVKKTQHVMHGHKYTPDFRMYPNMQYRDLFYAVFIKGEKIAKQKVPFISMGEAEHDIVVEIKPAFDRHNMTRLVLTNLKWVFDKYLMHIQLVKVPDIFEKTFTPKKYIEEMVYKKDNRTKGKLTGQSRIKFKVKTIEEFKAELAETKAQMLKINSQKTIVEM